MTSQTSRPPSALLDDSKRSIKSPHSQYCGKKMLGYYMEALSSTPKSTMHDILHIGICYICRCIIRFCHYCHACSVLRVKVPVKSGTRFHCTARACPRQVSNKLSSDY